MSCDATGRNTRRGSEERVPRARQRRWGGRNDDRRRVDDAEDAEEVERVQDLADSAEYDDEGAGKGEGVTSRD